jgi:hypothetical protein
MFSKDLIEQALTEMHKRYYVEPDSADGFLKNGADVWIKIKGKDDVNGYFVCDSFSGVYLWLCDGSGHDRDGNQYSLTLIPHEQIERVVFPGIEVFFKRQATIMTEEALDDK